MENCDCFSLSQFIERKDFMTVAQVREIAWECLLGLRYLHEGGMAHGVND